MRDDVSVQNRAWWAALILTSVVALVYASSLTAPFLFDDLGAVVNNPTIRRLDSVAAWQPPTDGSTTTGRPLVNFSYAINYAVSGNNVWSYHVLNVVIHALGALTLMGLVRRVLAGPILGGHYASVSSRLAFAVALIWAVHPLLTETVVSTAQRTESLCALLYLLTLYGFTRVAGTRPPGILWPVLTVAGCLIGMAAKEVMVTAPIMVLLLDRTFFAGNFSAAWRQRRGLYLALGTTWLLLGVLLLRSEGARGVSAGFGLGLSSWSYLLTQCDALLIYVKLALWPYPLVLDYGTGAVTSIADVWWQGPTILVAILATLWALRRRRLWGFMGAACFVLLAPSSSFVPLVAQTMAEHRMYLPLAVLVSGAVVGIYSRCERWGWMGVGVVVASFVAITIARNRDYQDAVTIWSRNVADYPQSARGQNNLGWALHQAGRSAEAEVHFQRAIAIQPDYVSARYNWGVALLDEGRDVEAAEQFQAVVSLAPNHADAFLNLGNALMRQQRTQEAAQAYAAATSLRPSADAEYNLGIAKLDAGDQMGAMVHFRTAAEMNPALSAAHYQLALLATTSEEAELQYRATLRTAPEHIGAHRKFGLWLARAGRLAEAEEQLRAVVAAEPTDADALANLGNVLSLQGKVREAIQEYQAALRLRPDDARLRENLAVAQEASLSR